MPEYTDLVIKVKTEGDVQAAAKKLGEATGKLGGIEIDKHIAGLGTHLKELGKVSTGLIETITKGPGGLLSLARGFGAMGLVIGTTIAAAVAGVKALTEQADRLVRLKHFAAGIRADPAQVQANAELMEQSAIERERGLTPAWTPQ